MRAKYDDQLLHPEKYRRRYSSNYGKKKQGNYGDSFEIGRDIVVSTDEEFLNILRSKKVTSNGSLCLYEYEIPSDIVNFDTVYIKPPVLYIPTEISAVSCKLSEGEVMKTSDGEKDWFRITSVRTAEMTQTTWLVDIEIEAIEGDLPRFPKIDYDGQIIGGVSSLSFDNESNPLSDVFEFKGTAYDGQMVDNMLYSGNLVISEALLRAEAERFPVESNIQSLTVIIK